MKVFQGSECALRGMFVPYKQPLSLFFPVSFLWLPPILRVSCYTTLREPGALQRATKQAAESRNGCTK